jgi:hypothetical protein
MSRDYQDEYDRDQVQRHGGSCGNYTVDPAQIDDGISQLQPEPGYGYEGEPQQFAPQYEQPAYEPEPAYYEEAGPEFVDQLQPPDPLVSDNWSQEMEAYLEQRDAQQGVDLDQQAAEWETSPAVQSAQAQAQEAALTEQGYQMLMDDADRLFHGRLADDPMIHAEVAGTLATQTLADAERLATELVNEGYPPEEIPTAIGRFLPALQEGALPAVRHELSVQDMRRQVRAHYGLS